MPVKLSRTLPEQNLWPAGVGDERCIVPGRQASPCPLFNLS